MLYTCCFLGEWRSKEVIGGKSKCRRQNNISLWLKRKGWTETFNITSSYDQRFLFDHESKQLLKSKPLLTRDRVLSMRFYIKQRPTKGNTSVKSKSLHAEIRLEYSKVRRTFRKLENRVFLFCLLNLLGFYSWFKAFWQTIPLSFFNVR